MRTFHSMAAVISLAVVASSAPAAVFTGWSSSMATNGIGQEVWSLHANFDESGLVLSQLLNYQSISGALSALHTNMIAGIWNPTATGVADAMNDSYVTATGSHGSGTGLMFEDTSPSSLQWNAGWYPIQTTVMGQSWKVAQVVRAAGGASHTAALRIGYKVAGTTTILYGEGQWTVGIPAPAATALLALGTLCRPRRR